jgi:predicted dehydrogenase/threonine dehydrogenase-like Zn-dependent dehydrogenase
MKQILQNLKTGKTELMEVPCPIVKPGHLLIETAFSVISAGTERMLVEFGKANYLSKAKQQPDKVKQVFDKLKTDGILSTLNSVQAKLDQPLPLGYSNAGTVIEVGKGVDNFNIGDRVISNGPHSEVVCVPKNLCAKIPEGVSDEEAAFTVLASIALQGVRLARPTLGENFVVTGLGLIGQLVVQILIAQGCQVLAIDFDKDRLGLAKRFGAETVDLSKGEDLISKGLAFSKGQGVDGVIIAASTKSSEPVHQAARMCRKRGRIVLVGVTGLELSRADFYEKELTFQVSCSYGPGRYDKEYEIKGQDYPFGLVRWTEQRNFEAILQMMQDKRLNVLPLISHRFPFEKAEAAYKLISSRESSLGIVLQYSLKKEKESKDLFSRNIILVQSKNAEKNPIEPVIGMIGAGNFTNQVLLPALKKTNVRLKSIASSGGVSGTYLGKKYGFEQSITDVDRIFNDPEINVIFITTRHNSHAQFVCRALEAGKNVFVEKPMAITLEELEKVIEIYNNSRKQNSPTLMVGFNRRFAPHIVKMKSLLDTIKEPKSFIITVNAGQIPADHWTQDPKVGGGRIIGEGCHFIDLMRFLVGHPITGVKSTVIGNYSKVEPRSDKITFTMTFADGSFGTVHYLANGHKSFPKERVEVFCAGRILSLDNFRVLRGYGWPGFKKMRLLRQDKGHAAEIQKFIEAIKEGKKAPISAEEIFEVTRVSFEIGKDIN